MKTTQTILLHLEAPKKPPYGSQCNRCGVCCAAEPCPVAHLFLWQFTGACRALQWQETEQCYACGMAVNPKQFIKFIPRNLESYFARWFAKRIAAGIGCDSKVGLADSEQFNR